MPHAPRDRSRILKLLDDWHRAGWIGPLEPALARWMAERDPDIAPELLFLAAITVHLEGLGHTSLDVPAFLAQPLYYLDWPEQAGEALEEFLAAMGSGPEAWQAALIRGGRMLAQYHDRTPPNISQRGPETPLVWDGRRLYLRRHFRDEWEIDRQLQSRVGTTVAYFSEGSATLTRLFGPASSSSAGDGQRLACALAAERGFTLITGGPGSGKTYTIARLLVLLMQAAPRRVALAAPTGKAALRMDTALRQSVDDFVRRGDDDLADLLRQVPPAQTLHRLLGARPGTRRLRHDAHRPLNFDLLVVDEASMIQHDLMAALLRATPARSQLILLGDPDQLASVEAGAVLAEICRGRAVYSPATAEDLKRRWGIALAADSLRDDASALEEAVVRLSSSYRFDGPIAKLATAIRSGDAECVIDLLAASTTVEGSALGWIDPRAGAGRANFLELAERTWRSTQARLEQVPSGETEHATWVRELLAAADTFRILCALREGPWGVAGINAQMAAQLRPPGYSGDWYPGRPVLVQRNDPIAGVYNGDLGLVLPDTQGRLQVYFPRGPQLAPLRLHPQRLGDATSAYALTVHKAQGSEFQRVLLILPPEDSPVLSRELLYTAVTRARREFIAVTPLETLSRILGRHGRRMSGLATRLFPEVSGH
ncbi:exodeoxyribonuclease V subunit alpha [Acidithiobacillus caldus]|uniref:RecBCD enzyme subunit RecD n=1 Tax=Acidithiobacillus caldus (strain ATCC 51756 / DSM 8584 / KU) TaxID=637389 RepID=A0A059ZRK7_ACICK|nr:exodeoxyribonuclease V subunit alpha [Acidithiobacillus caldus]AIA54173.1 Exodeoxyribonuclease V alpha chain [Acidithiobacillus caldus ATCC 51756]MBU2730483.1 exodeoxyribonuclease V subunit alpha [Acidithiobacillus caldus]MBU2736877.1 exodeoxyribonuclease V subunit alpha [Acidithiobacillus caldus ATCC 51756]MBU2744052.1 exodeoxyribonuclease V subunit alpha [Acidithiobacillus caldus]MBU2779892.1 exodeoxyribonuclease V subunit alpha [Acidithiobacillus caldus]